jgi:hypothetical protein
MSSVAAIQQGTPAAESPLRQGTATIALGAKIVAVADTAITASSLVVAWGIGAADATAFVFSADVINAGVGFSIGTNANTTAAKSVGWAVLRY